MRTYYLLQMELTNEIMTYTRESSGFLGILAEVGGLGWILMVFLAFLLRPWAEFHYTLEALQQLYRVKSKEEPKLRKCTDGSTTLMQKSHEVKPRLS